MPKGKKKNAKKPAGPPILTTVQIAQDRMRMMAPRLGDVYEKSQQVERILEDVALRILQKSSSKEAEALNLCSMKLNQFPDISRISMGLQSLTDVNLSKNNLFDGDQLFKGLSTLNSILRLNLSENFLNGVLSVLSGSLASIEELHLDVNQLTSFSPAVSNWTSIKVLTFSDNLITAIPTEASQWMSLVHFNAKNNKIADLPGAVIQNWSQLEKCYMGSNLLKSVPEEIGYLSNLVELDLSSNALDMVPLNLTLCTNIEKLHLGCNKLALVQPEIFQSLTKLKELQLYKNKIAIIPNEIGQLKRMERFSVASNNIKTLPDEIGECCELKELYLSNNAKLTSFPGTAGHLRMLQELSLRKCPALKQLPSSAAEMTSLRELDMRAVKKQVCKIDKDVWDSLCAQRCVLRGGIIKKAKKSKAKPAK